jgi:hypothetical protein
MMFMFNLGCVVRDDSDGGCCLGSFRVDDGGTTVLLLVRHQAIVSYPEFGSGGRAVGAAGDSSSATDDRVPIEDDDVWTAQVDVETALDRQPPLPLPVGTRLCWRRIGSSSAAVVHAEWILVDNTLPGSPLFESTLPVPISGRDGQLYWRLDAPGPAMPVYNPQALAGKCLLPRSNRHGVVSL